MNLFLSRTCSLATTTVLLQKHSFYLSLSQNCDGNVKHKHVTHSSKKSVCLCVCMGLASLEAALMAPLYLSVYVTKQNKEGNNMPSAHSYCLTTGSLAGGWFVSQTGHGDSLWHQPAPLDSSSTIQQAKTSSTIQQALQPWTLLLATPRGPIML